MEHNSSTEFDTASLESPFLAWHTKFIASLITAPTGHYNEAYESNPRRYLTFHFRRLSSKWDSLYKAKRKELLYRLVNPIKELLHLAHYNLTIEGSDVDTSHPKFLRFWLLIF